MIDQIKIKIKQIIKKKINKLSTTELIELSNLIRSFLIQSNSKTGGHIGANLSVVDLTIALHKVFDLKNDKIVFDTGHQGYTHRILTGRISLFEKLNKKNGMNRFLSRFESKYDAIDASHAGTALSIASGLSYNNLKKKKQNIISVVGDGSLVEGMTFEAINFSSTKNLKYIIVLNDNGMAIAPNVGGVKFFTSKNKKKNYAKDFFKAMNLDYIYVLNGHDIKKLSEVFLKLKKNLKKTTVVHVKTTKGHGLDIASKHKYKLHFSTPFNIKDIKSASPTIHGITFSSEIALYLERALEKDKKIFILTPGTPYASNLDDLLKKYPNNVIDVGMAEQHIFGMAAGLALQGKKPIICIQSTFMQRAYDQIIHDLCFMKLGVTIIAYRSGFSGYDSPTHHGLYDISYLSSIPNLEIMYPTCPHDANLILNKRIKKNNGTSIMLVPYEPIKKKKIPFYKDYGFYKIIKKGTYGSIFCLGNQLENAINLQKFIYEKRQINFSLICIRSIKPLNIKKLITNLKRDKIIISIEESNLNGGLGEKLSSILLEQSINSKFIKFGIKDIFADPGDKDDLMKKYKIDYLNIYKKIQNYL